MAKQSWYVVWKGKMPGIYTSWEKCREQIEGVEGARYRKANSEAEAVHMLQHPESVHKKRNTITLAPKNQSSSKPLIPSISVDASSLGNPGIMEYRGVDTHTGKVIFNSGVYPNGTNNIGEFLAIVHAMAMQTREGTTYPVYSDSATALAWIRSKKAKTTLVRNAENSLLFEHIDRAERWLKEHRLPAPVYKWDTKGWGEIPADFGRK